MDSFKLINIKVLLVLFISGASLCFAAYYITSLLEEFFNISHIDSIRYLAPVVEEFLKFSIVLLIILRKHTGFLIDAVIYGFVIGAGFAVNENIFYYYNLENIDFLIHGVRGFGTALMHSFATAMAAALLKFLIDKSLNYIIIIILSYLPAAAIHIFYNSFLLPALLQTAIIMLMFVITVSVLFSKSENNIKAWISREFDSEMNLIMLLDTGKFSETHAGKYIREIRNRFSPFVIVDMICILRLNLELSMQLKTNLLLAESGIAIPKDVELIIKLKEFHNLSKNIGKTGMLALKPVMSDAVINSWKINKISER